MRLLQKNDSEICIFSFNIVYTLVFYYSYNGRRQKCCQSRNSPSEVVTSPQLQRMQNKAQSISAPRPHLAATKKRPKLHRHDIRHSGGGCSTAAGNAKRPAIMKRYSSSKRTLVQACATQPAPSDDVTPLVYHGLSIKERFTTTFYQTGVSARGAATLKLAINEGRRGRQ